MWYIVVSVDARVAKLADALDLGSSVLGREGSSPSLRKQFILWFFVVIDSYCSFSFIYKGQAICFFFYFVSFKYVICGYLYHFFCSFS